MMPSLASLSALVAMRAVPALCALAAGVASAQTIERVKLTDNELNCQQIYAETQQMDNVIQLAGPGLPVAPPAAAPAAAFQPAMPLSAVQQAVLNHPNNANLTPEQKATLIAQTGMAEQRGNAAFLGLQGANRAGPAAAGADWQQQLLAAKLAAATPADRAGLLAQIGGANPAAIHAAAVQQGLTQGQPVAPAVGQAYAQAGGLAGILGSGMSAQGGSGSNAAGLAGMFGALAGMAKAAAPAPALAAPAQAVAPASGGGMGAQARARKEHLTSMFLARGCKLSDISK